MSERTERTDAAFALFKVGFNCGQSVLGAFCEKYGMDKDMAMKVSSGLGSGFRMGEICGAVSGAGLVIGLKYGCTKEDDAEAKNNCNKKTAEFMRLFKERNQSIVCRELLGIDMATKEGQAEAREKNVYKTVCAKKVINAVQILEELGY